MSPTDFMRLPPAIRIIVAVMLWPAVWAGVLLTVALARDLVRQTKSEPSPAAPRDVLIGG